MLFMKGTPSSPQCGFSRQMVGILRENSVKYGFFNILADDEVRQGLKEYAEWPTYPQLWMDGELVGGLDIVKEEMENNGEFFKAYTAAAADVAWLARAAAQIDKAADTVIEYCCGMEGYKGNWHWGSAGGARGRLTNETREGSLWCWNVSVVRLWGLQAGLDWEACYWGLVERVRVDAVQTPAEDDPLVASVSHIDGREGQRIESMRVQWQPCGVKSISCVGIGGG
ncbi:hypothetical protein NLG97_g11251 [Lecanicillium saksenae]|uniref:Uncharacterized protein n=1 Tax=Lecanicillium saksenae TaxID=468837 RepID=A0ACC1QCL6_9HYPO|nr:hypothetical protein NLG97_g11251 [Lecanicillium saksenae]